MSLIKIMLISCSFTSLALATYKENMTMQIFWGTLLIVSVLLTISKNDK